MNNLENEKYMTIAQLAEVLDVSRDLIEKRVKELFPNRMKKGKTTFLNQLEVTKIKLRIQENSSIITSDERRRQITNKTKLEKQLLVKQAMQYLNEEIAELKRENQIHQDRINLLIHDNKTYTTTEIAKELNLKSANQLNKMLEEKEVQYKMNRTWVLTAKYSDCGYENIKQQELDNGKIIYNRHWTGKGRDFILNILKG
jgi:Mn-dependent DtxR family transcriptional regulator